MREACGGEIASHSVCLCISLYLDFYAFPSTLPACCPLPKKKPTPKPSPKTSVDCRKQSSFSQCLKYRVREDQQSWKLYLTELGCCALGNSSFWARLLLSGCLKRREMTVKRGELLCTPAQYPVVALHRLCSLSETEVGEIICHWKWAAVGLPSPSPVLAGGERCWQNHPLSSFYCQLGQVRQPFLSSCPDGKHVLLSTAKTL